MKYNALLLAATLAATTIAAVAAPSAHASDQQVSRWLSATDHALGSRLERAHIASGDRTVDVRLDIGGEYLRDPQVVKSSGSRRLDASVAAALRGVAVQTPPSGLVGQTLLIHVPVAASDVAYAGGAALQ